MLSVLPEQSIKDYELFEDFYQKVFIRGNSYFNENIQIFNDENFLMFEDKFIKSYVEGKELSFQEKTLIQTKNTKKNFKHLFANYLWLYNYFFSSVDNGTYKVNKEVMSKVQDTGFLLDEELDVTLFPLHGFANCGMSYILNKYEELCIIHYFFKYIYQNNNILKNKQELINFIKNINIKDIYDFYRGKNYQLAGIKNILLFLLFPNDFEPIVNYTHKKMIVQHYLGNKSSKDFDEDIYKIRISKNIKKSFYDNEIEKQWNDRAIAFTEISKTVRLGSYLNSLRKPIQNFEIYYKSDYSEEFDQKYSNGIEAEELVFKHYFNKYLQKKKNISVKIVKKLQEINFYEQNRENLSYITSKPAEELVHFSKYIHSRSPFDIICPINESVFFIEVKSISENNNTIYFSQNELRFACENIDDYIVVIVKNKEIYKFEEVNNRLVELYEDIKKFKEVFPYFDFDSIKIKIDI